MYKKLYNRTMDKKIKTENTETIRINKYLSNAGVCSRRDADQFTDAGRVTLDGRMIKTGEKIPADAVVCLDGRPVIKEEKKVVLLFYKPRGIVCSTRKQRNETTVTEYLNYPLRIYPVGRLDKDTEGLLLITDDGALAHELLSPKKHVDKTYYAVTDGCMTKEDVQRFADGLEIGEKNPTMPAKLEILSTRKVEETELEQYPSGWSSEIQLTIKEGKFHQVKRMTEAVGKKVVYLKRISMGVLTLSDDLKKGECRQLTAEEEKRLKESVVIK